MDFRHVILHESVCCHFDVLINISDVVVPREGIDKPKNLWGATFSRSKLCLQSGQRKPVLKAC